MKKLILAVLLILSILTVVGCQSNTKESLGECCFIQKTTLNKVTKFGDSILELSYKNSDFQTKSNELNELIAQIKREIDLDLVEKNVLVSLSILEQASEQIKQLGETSSQNEFAVGIDNISTNYEDAEKILSLQN